MCESFCRVCHISRRRRENSLTCRFIVIISSPPLPSVCSSCWRWGRNSLKPFLSLSMCPVKLCDEQHNQQQIPPHICLRDTYEAIFTCSELSQIVSQKQACTGKRCSTESVSNPEQSSAYPTLLTPFFSSWSHSSVHVWIVNGTVCCNNSALATYAPFECLRTLAANTQGVTSGLKIAVYLLPVCGSPIILTAFLRCSELLYLKMLCLKRFFI